MAPVGQAGTTSVDRTASVAAGPSISNPSTHGRGLDRVAMLDTGRACQHILDLMPKNDLAVQNLFREAVGEGAKSHRVTHGTTARGKSRRNRRR